MKLLHSADWHLDSPIVGRTPEQTAYLKAQLLTLPQKVLSLAESQGCDLVLLSGDLFDGTPSAQSLAAVRSALAAVTVPVYIAPGNHDFYAPDSPWASQLWPENVHIFTGSAITSVAAEHLSCRIYGAAFTAADADSLLEDFRPNGPETYHIALLHGDPTQAASPYNPVTAPQISRSGLNYLALGHIHKAGQLRVGDTLCAWPGCPMGRGFDELGDKGVLIVTLEQTVEAAFFPLDTPRFFDLSVQAEHNAAAAVRAALPALGSLDFYRIRLTGESAPLDIQDLTARFPDFPNLQLRDETVPPLDIWGTAGEDTLEGIYFGLLHSALSGSDEKQAQRIHLAAKISRQILLGQEVKLP